MQLIVTLCFQLSRILNAGLPCCCFETLASGADPDALSHRWPCDVIRVDWAMSRNVRSWKKKVWIETTAGGGWSDSTLHLPLTPISEEEKRSFTPPPPPPGFLSLEPRLGPAAAHLERGAAAGKGEEDVGVNYGAWGRRRQGGGGGGRGWRLPDSEKWVCVICLKLFKDLWTESQTLRCPAGLRGAETVQKVWPIEARTFQTHTFLWFSSTDWDTKTSPWVSFDFDAFTALRN